MIELELLQFTLGNRSSISHIPSQEEWQRVYDFADRQAILGLLFDGVERLHTAQGAFTANLPKKLLLEWIGNVEQLRHETGQAIKQARRLCEEFSRAGFRTCILKGVGNLLFYGGLLRTTGDIDLWVMPVGETSVSRARKMTQDYVHTIFPDARGEFVHMDWPWKEEPSVEIHFTPSMDANPWVDGKLQCFFEQNAEACFANVTRLGFAVPTRVVNGVFLLHHTKRHFMNEGVGLRHIVDYALYLRSLNEEELNEVWRLLGKFNLRKFAGAVMYIINEVLGYGFLKEGGNDSVMSWPADRKVGEYLLREMLAGGNFGHYDRRKNRQNGIMNRWIWFVRLVINRMRFFLRDALWSFCIRFRIGVSNVINK